MSRKKREWFSGAKMHVMAHSVQKTALFKADDDYQVFLKIIEKTMDEMYFEMYAYCMMTNHFHLLIGTKDRPIWIIMNRILTNYAKYYNYKYGYVGHLFDSRYASSVIKDPVYLVEVSRYIHLNPVKARMVLYPEDYAFSSYRSYINQRCDHMVQTDEILQYFPQKDTVQKYREFVEARALAFEEPTFGINKEGKKEEWLPWGGV